MIDKKGQFVEKNIFELQGNSLEAFYQLVFERKKPSSSSVIKKMVLKK